MTDVTAAEVRAEFWTMGMVVLGIVVALLI